MIAFIDYRTTIEERQNLSALGLNYLEVPKYSVLYNAIDGHVDIQLNILDKLHKKIIIHKDMNESFIKSLNDLGIDYIKSNASLSGKYPGDIILNAAILESDVIHNFKFTDINLIRNISDKKHININQGYSKCSILPVREKAIITNDPGISSSLVQENYDVLLLPPGDIILPGLDYGFIGGVGGKINDDTLAFFGNLESYKYGDAIKSFLSKYDIRPVYLRKGKLFDRGSLMVL